MPSSRDKAHSREGSFPLLFSLDFLPPRHVHEGHSVKKIDFLFLFFFHFSILCAVVGTGSVLFDCI